MLNTVAELIDAVRKGEMIVVVDDEQRENEGDLIMAASHVNAAAINFMARYARGLICLTLTENHCKQLNLPLMVSENREAQETKFTVSIEAAHGVTTGISAADRAHTIHTAAQAHAKPSDIVQPGHVFPLQAEPGGVLSRAGHTEAGCDLARLAGLLPAAVIIEIMNEDGSMARLPELIKFAKKHELKIGAIADLIQYRMLHEKTIERVAQREITTDLGKFTLHTFRDTTHGRHHLALTLGKWNNEEPVPVRVHLPELLRDAVGVQLSDNRHQSGWNIQRCMTHIAEEGRGALILIGGARFAKQSGFDAQHNLDANQEFTNLGAQIETNPPYLNIGVGSQILRELGVGKMQLMAAPTRYISISGFGLEVVEYLRYHDKPSN